MKKTRLVLLLIFALLAGIVTNSCKKDVTLPTLTTNSITAITLNSATSGGDITSTGHADITARGVCYGTERSPSISGTSTSDGTGSGSFTSSMTDLTPNTLYYVRAYATNKAGTAYGSEVSFSTTAIVIPTLTTTTVTGITVTSAISGGNITVDGGGPVTARGVCWATTTGPTTASSLTSDGTGTGTFVSNLSSLLPNTAYYLRAYATNSAGTAYGNEVTFSTLLNGPTNVSATAGNAQATITFTAPVGGLPITGYTVTSTPGNFTGTGTVSPIIVTGLTNGTAYTFTVIATNANGNSSPSLPSNSVTPSTVPGAPTIGTATAGNAQATVTFTAPVSNGGSVITGYTVTSTPGNITGTGTVSPIIVTGLTNGTAYTFTVVATNAKGNSLLSSVSNSVTLSAVPGTPTIGTATKGNAQASVAFTPPVSNGGSVITGYTVTSTPGNFTGTGTGSPITVTGLANGTAYTFTVIATNANGNSLPSAASNSVTPSTVPGVPTIGTATKGNAQASVTFTPPVSNGGSAITGYTVTSTPGSFTGTGTVSPIVVTGLANGTAYTFTVIATNANGNSTPSSASNSVTPSGVPGAPAIGTATGGNAQASVAFTAPGSNGGSPITGYTVTSTPGNFTGTGTGSPITVTGLANGTAYTFTVIATNANGNSLPSTASNSVTPSGVPGAPTIGTATGGDTQATVAFTAPGSNGGSAITGYTVTSNPGNITKTGAVSPITVTGLTNGTAYTFTVVATNANGNSIPSSASNSVTPLAASTVSDIDGNVYNIVTIGTQQWLAQNLKTSKYNNGTAITPVTGTGTELAWAALTTAAYCDYNDLPANSLVYGKLYNWFVVASTNPLNVCPTGWHVPTDLDFDALATTLGGVLAAGIPMKATTLWAASSFSGTNTSGFTGLPGGFRLETGFPASITLTGPYWTSNQNLSQTTEGIGYSLHSADAALTRAGFVKQIGCGIRCVK